MGVCNVKGGTGKTITSINLAYRLKEMGIRVGLLDADVDNASFATFVNAPPSAQIQINEKRFVPWNWDGIPVFSMSLIAGRERGVSMTGDRYQQILADAVENSVWDVDCMVVDMPAGSGDVFRAAIEIFAQSYAGSVIVSQPLLVDATRRVLNLHRYFEIPVLGVVENMSYFKCGHNEIYYPFGQSKLEELCESFGVELLGKIPLTMEIADGVAKGNPIIAGEGAEVIRNVAKRVAEAPVQKIGLLERLKKKIRLEEVKTAMERVLAGLILSISKEFNLGEIRKQKGFTEKRPFLLVVTDESGSKEITRVAMRIEEDGLKVIKNPKEVDFEIASDFKTLARMIMGKKRVGEKLVDTDPIDFWLAGDVKVYGRGFAPRVVDVIRNVFRDEALMASVREKYGKILSRWL
ncbi:MAG: P-loop NTPase [Candidatus Hadarchaeales archaeon]